MASRARNRVLTTSGADAPLDLARRIALIEKRGPGRATAEERGADVAPSIQMVQADSIASATRAPSCP